MLSMVLTAATVFPDISGEMIIGSLGVGSALDVAEFVAILLLRRRRGTVVAGGGRIDARRLRAQRATWRMPPLGTLAPALLSVSKRIWMIVLRCHLVAAVALVAVKVIQIAVGSKREGAGDDCITV